MTANSPTIDRVIAVLGLFLEHPRQAFTVTEVAKTLGFSRPTVAAILSGFVEKGYLYRRSDRNYVLGRALHTIAVGSRQTLSPLAVASQEMRSLADDLGVVAAALFFENGEIVVRERAASVRHLGGANLLMARRYPTRPWGLVFLTSFTDQHIESTLAALTPPLGSAELANVHKGIAFARQHGFSPLFIPDTEEHDETHWRPSGVFMSEIDALTVYRPRSIVAPVTASESGAAFGIALHSFLEPMTGREILDAGTLLRQTCDRIAEFLTHKRPVLDL